MKYPSQQERLRELFSEEIHKIKLADTVTHLDVNGPGLVIAGNPPQPSVGWTFGLSLKHHVLLGQPDLMITVPVAAVLPPDEMIPSIAEFLMEEGRKERDKQSNTPLPPVPNGDIPAGLRGKKIGL